MEPTQNLTEEDRQTILRVARVLEHRMVEPWVANAPERQPTEFRCRIESPDKRRHKKLALDQFAPALPRFAFPSR